MTLPTTQSPLRLNKPLPPLLPAINISRFDVSTPEDFQGLGRRPVESSKASTRRNLVDASPGDIGLFSPPPPIPPKASSPLNRPLPPAPVPIQPKKSPEPRGRPSSQYQLFPTIRPTPGVRRAPRKSLPKPPVPEQLPPSPRQEGASDRTSRPVRDPSPGAGPSASGHTSRDRRSASEFATATAMMDLPPEFASSVSGAGSVVANEGGVAAEASLPRTPEVAPSISGGEGLVEGDEEGAMQSWWESSESSSGDSNITTVYVGNRL